MIPVNNKCGDGWFPRRVPGSARVPCAIYRTLRGWPRTARGGAPGFSPLELSNTAWKLCG